MTDKLRFAPLIRVSTDRQEKQGESLRVQRNQLDAAVKALGGTIFRWYAGQEHATVEQERRILEKLMEDAQAHKFDAIVVADLSRWSRDNQRSKADLKILKAHGIRFFVGTQEYNLHEPTQSFLIGVSTEVAEFFARQQTYKSQLSRIARASDGRPTSGKLPFGRTYNKETQTWAIDREKQKKVVWAAKEYLRGKSLKKIAQELGMAESNIWRILNCRSGDTWEVAFRSKQHAIDKKIVLKIPPLLDSEMIRKIHEHAQANRTYLHGMKQHQYLLGRMIFCLQCGSSMFGSQHKQKGGKSVYRFYRHTRKLGNRSCAHPRLLINADRIEETVLMRVFAVLGDPEGLEKAMLKAIPDQARIKGLREKKQFLESELSKTETQKNRVIERIAEGIISKEEAEKKMKEIRDRETSLKGEIEIIDPQLSNIPSEEEIKHKAKMIERIASQIYGLPSRLEKMSFDDKRKLVVSFFAGKDSGGNRLGVYVEKKDGSIRYQIRRTFNQVFRGTITKEGPDILDFWDVGVDQFEELRKAVKGGKKHVSSSQYQEGPLFA